MTSIKTQLKGQLILSNQNRENAAIDMAKQYLHKGTLRDLRQTCSMIDKVSANDVQSLASRILNPDNLLTLIYS